MHVECIVRYEGTSKHSGPITKLPQHERDTGPGCIAAMSDVSVTTGGWDELQCPDSACNRKLEFGDVLLHLLRGLAPGPNLPASALAPAARPGIRGVETEILQAVPGGGVRAVHEEGGGVP